MVREVFVLGNPVLRTKCEYVASFHNESLQQEIQDIKETLEDFRQKNGFGRGIAAIQIGITKRIIGLNLGNGSFVVINPKITATSGEKMILWDDCMSFPDLVVKVERYKRINIEYQDETGARKEWGKLSPAESELLQHEIDHLDGVMAIDKAMDSKSILYKSEYRKNVAYYQQMTMDR